MLLRLSRPDGTVVEHPLTEHPITIGRSPDADLIVQDEKASRLHSGIRFENDGYYLRDLKSKNGTYLNEERIESVRIQPGDRIRIGSVIIRVEQDSSAGPDTALSEMEEEMASGKGYGTILKELVGSTEEPPPKSKRTKGKA